ncbi:hypothetical protein HDA35_005768 [Micromonospora purpureochromogenes]|uniref:Uncharacterized protein n=1 Tax=Micromonospora purpureochromogenes TaxID=47872 RepID=A0ABX2RX84_9ACTN|nr:hypothetical protein [Micromonospora purpureochromogenes]
MTRIRLLAYVILDGTLIPVDRVHDQKPYYSGKAPTARDERAGNRGCGRTPRLGVGGTSRLGTRPDCCANPRHHRRVDQR